MLEWQRCQLRPTLPRRGDERRLPPSRLQRHSGRHARRSLARVVSPVLGLSAGVVPRGCTAAKHRAGSSASLRSSVPIAAIAPPRHSAFLSRFGFLDCLGRNGIDHTGSGGTYPRTHRHRKHMQALSQLLENVCRAREADQQHGFLFRETALV